MKQGTSRAFDGGVNLGRSIVEMVNLMYQNNTAKNFYEGLLFVLNEEVAKRKGKVGKPRDTK